MYLDVDCFVLSLVMVLDWLVVGLKFGDVSAFGCLIAVVGFAADVWL